MATPLPWESSSGGSRPSWLPPAPKKAQEEEEETGPTYDDLLATARQVAKTDPQLAPQASEAVRPTPSTFLDKVLGVVNKPREFVVDKLFDEKSVGEYLERENPSDSTFDKWSNRIGGFLGDVVLDPITYLTGGTGAAGKTAAKAAASGVLKEAAEGAVKRVSQEGAERGARFVADAGGNVIDAAPAAAGTAPEAASAAVGTAVKEATPAAAQTAQKPLSRGAQRILDRFTPEEIERAREIYLSGAPQSTALNQLRREGLGDIIKALPKEARGGIRWRIPGATSIAGREVSATLVPAAVTNRIASPLAQGARRIKPLQKVADELSWGRGLERTGRKGYEAVQGWRALGGLENQVKGEADRVLRTASKAFKEDAQKEELLRVWDEGAEIPEHWTPAQREVAEKGRQWYDRAQATAREQGLDVNYRQNYHARVRTPEAEEYIRGADVRQGQGVKSRDVNQEFERTLGDMPLREANEIMRRRVGLPEGTDYYELDPIKAFGQHARQYPRKVREKAWSNQLQGAGIISPEFKRTASGVWQDDLQKVGVSLDDAVRRISSGDNDLLNKVPERSREGLREEVQRFQAFRDGAGKPTEVGPRHLERVRRYAEQHGGATWDPWLGKFHGKKMRGYAVDAIDDADPRVLRFTDEEFGSDALRRAVDHYADLFTSDGGTRYRLGVWKDTDSGMWQVVPTEVYADLAKAQKAAQRRNQRYIYDFRKGDTVEVPRGEATPAGLITPNADSRALRDWLQANPPRERDAGVAGDYLNRRIRNIYGKHKAMEQGRGWPAPKFENGAPGPEWGRLDDSISVGPLRGQWAPRQVALELNKTFAPRNMPGLFKALEGFNRHFKFLVTVPWPGFHARNFLGAGISNLAGGVGVPDYVTFWRVMRGGPQYINRLGMTADEAKGLLQQFIPDDLTALSEVAQRAGSNADKAYQFLGKISGGNMLMRNIEGLHRGAAFLHGLTRFSDPHAARAFTMVRHGDYSELTPAEEHLRALIPFYKWMRTNLPMQVMTLAEAPARALMPVRAMRAMEGPQRREEFEQEGNLVSPLAAAGGAILNPLNSQPSMLQVDFPVQDLNQYIRPAEGVGGTAKALMASSHPIIKALTEAATKQRLYGSGSIKDWSPVPTAMRPVALLLEKTPGLSGLVNRARGGELLWNASVRRLVETLPTSRLTGTVGQLAPTPGQPAPPTQNTLIQLLTGVSDRPVTEESQQMEHYARDKRLGELVSELYRRGFKEDFRENKERKPGSTPTGGLPWASSSRSATLPWMQ